MSRLFRTAPMLELDHVHCCNRSADSESSDSDPGVVFTGQLNTVVKRILDIWPATAFVDVHLRQRPTHFIDDM